MYMKAEGEKCVKKFTINNHRTPSGACQVDGTFTDVVVVVVVIVKGGKRSFSIGDKKIKKKKKLTSTKTNVQD